MCNQRGHGNDPTCKAVLLGFGARHELARVDLRECTNHEIATDGNPPGETVIALGRFEAQMRWLAEHTYRTLSMAELVAIVAGRAPMPARAVVLTFDDGWKNVLNAVPVLERHRMKASFWIIAGKGIGDDYMV